MKSETSRRIMDAARAKAKEIGLADTHFMNPHGLDDPAHLSSAADLAALARYALRSEPLFDDYVDTAHHTVLAGAKIELLIPPNWDWD